MENNNEKLNWKPEVGKTAWTRADMETIIEVMVVSPYGQVQNYFDVKGKGWRSNRQEKDLFPTAEAAISSIRVFDLEGNRMAASPAKPDLLLSILAEEGRVLSPLEKQFYDFCKQDPENVAKFALSLIGDGAATGGKSESEVSNV